MPANPEQHPPRPATMSRGLAAVGLISAVLTPLIIDYWILKVRWVWIETFPQENQTRPPTISRAMADTDYGAALSVWLSVAALFLLLGAAMVTLLYIRTLRALPPDLPGRRSLLIWSMMIMGIQIPVSAGIIMQSLFSLETNNALHMAGSYILFVGAGLGQIISIVITAGVLRMVAGDHTIAQRGLIRPGAARFRRAIAGVALITALSYLALFIIKDHWSSTALYQTYVWTEIALIALLMSTLMLHAPEFLRLLTRRGPSPSASRTPASPAEGR